MKRLWKVVMGVVVLGFLVGLGCIGFAEEKEQGLVGYWRLDEGKGSIARDYSGNENHGIIKGDAKWVVEKGIKYTSFSALEFDGKSAYVDCGSDPELNPTQAMTFEVWFKTDGEVANVDLFAREMSQGGYEPYRFVILPDGTLQFAPTDSKCIRYFSFVAGRFVPGQWTHFAVSWDGSIVKMFINGEKKAQYSFSDIKTSPGITVIGRRGYPANFFKGLIREVKLYNRALGEEEIKKHGSFVFSVK